MDVVRCTAAALQALAQAGVGLRSQHPFCPSSHHAPAALVLLTEPIHTTVLRPLLQRLAQLPGVVGVPQAIRMSNLDSTPAARWQHS